MGEQWLSQLNNLVAMADKIETAQAMQAAWLMVKAWDGSWLVATCPRCLSDATGFDSTSLGYGKLVTSGSSGNGGHVLLDSIVLVVERNQAELAASFVNAGVRVRTPV